jgi:hypothetical protein
MQNLGPRYDKAAEIRSDLSGALEAEILDQEELFISEGLDSDTEAAGG